MILLLAHDSSRGISRMFVQFEQLTEAQQNGLKEMWGGTDACIIGGDIESMTLNFRHRISEDFC